MKALRLTLSISIYSTVAFAQDSKVFKLDMSKQEMIAVIKSSNTPVGEVDSSKLVQQNISALYSAAEDIDRVITSLGIDRDLCEGKNKLQNIGDEKRFCIKQDGKVKVSAFGNKSKEVDFYGASVATGSGQIQFFAKGGMRKFSAGAAGKKMKYEAAQVMAGISIPTGGKTSRRHSEKDRKAAIAIANLRDIQDYARSQRGSSEANQ